MRAIECEKEDERGHEIYGQKHFTTNKLINIINTEHSLLEHRLLKYNFVGVIPLLLFTIILCYFYFTHTEVCCLSKRKERKYETKHIKQAVYQKVY